MVGVYSPTLSPWLAWTSYGLGGSGTLEDATSEAVVSRLGFDEPAVIRGKLIILLGSSLAVVPQLRLSNPQGCQKSGSSNRQL